ncbi:MAG: 3-hydroxyacyl-CoA dehydrogenase/enoyl-CoA hydratase family protein [Proteobacteria bacterium]|nr:3-hydroxyacyl-CoA dehydrogenase/enoyl-CoA hydratase family protein [Pseudomonadota bacterium]
MRAHSMAYSINKVAVLGAGVMGQGIAAHLANARIESVLYDINMEAAQAGLKNAVKLKPAGGNTSLFFKKSDAKMVTAATYDDAGAKLLGECDLIIEVVVERMDIKHKVFSWVGEHRAKGSIVASNTSGLSLAGMGEVMDEEMRSHFLVMHFFNPVRYMRLLELVSGPETLPEVTAAITEFGEKKLGKGIVTCKDTPNFIANRIGTYGIMSVLHHMPTIGLNIAEVDAIFGKPMGRPASAVFRTGDLVGIDTLAHVIKTVYDSCPDDPERDKFVVPAWVEKMVAEGDLGGKTGKGFYWKTKIDGKKAILARNVETGEYENQGRPKFASVKAAKSGGLKALVAGDDKAAKIAWLATADTLIYAAGRIPEIADDIVNIDRGMRWGFGWKIGVFESWDKLGVRSSVERMKAEGRTVPAWVEAMLATGRETFYTRNNGVDSYWCAIEGVEKTVEGSSGWLILKDVKDAGGLVAKNVGADLIDLGDGVLNLSFHTKMNALDADIFELYNQALDELEEGKWEALVVGSQGGPAFCAGANIFMLVMLAMQQEWGQIEEMVGGMQTVLKRAQYNKRPVVTAPRGLTLGGGLEVAMQSSACQAGGELYAGLVEVGVGLIPAGGGCKEVLARSLGNIPEGVEYDPNPFVQQAFKNIGLAQVATSCEEARAMGYLRPHDRITMDEDALIQDAKDLALGMVKAGYAPPKERTFMLPGPSGRSAIELFLYQMHQGGFATDHDMVVSGKLAHIMTGGDIPTNTWVTEQHVLDLEREAFLSLCGETGTQMRIQHFLQTGKPLRN